MRRLIGLFLGVALLFGAMPDRSLAQVSSAVVVTACGTKTYTAGTSQAVTQDTTGKACQGAVVSGGSITANQGTAGAAAWPTKIDQTTPGTTNGVVVNSSALPSGAATAANQTTANTSLSSIVTNTTGAATAAKQDTGNTSLGSIDTKLTSQATAANQATANSSLSTIVTNTGGYSFGNLDSNATTTLKTGTGTLHTVTINTRGVTSTVVLYDNIAGSGTKIATIDTTLNMTSFVFDAAFSTGITAVTTGGTPADLTVTYR